jgi:hypothetical protein
MAKVPEEKWVLISKNEPLSPGDRIRMYYSIIGPTFMLATQMAAIEKKLESDARFTLIATSLPEGDGWVKDIWFEILVKEPPKKTPPMQQAAIHVGIIAAVIASAFALLSVFCWLSLKEVRKMEIVPEVKEVIKETGWTALKIAAAAIVGLIALNWWKK